MSRPDNLPPSARAIALLLSSTPSIQDVQPAVIHQLLDFAHRYTANVLTDANVYAEYAGRANKIEMDDVVLAVQARVGWEFGGRVPKEYILSLAADVNAVPLPAVPEVFGVRMPPASECLTSIDFDLIPNKPPPDVKLYDEEVEEIEEEDEYDEPSDVEMEQSPPIPPPAFTPARPAPSTQYTEPAQEYDDTPFPISAIDTSVDLRIGSQPAAGEGSEAGDGEDGLFSGGEEEEEEEGDAMEEIQTSLSQTNGTKRKLEEDDDYD